MNLTRHKDGDDESTGVSYLELVQVLIQHGANTNADLRQLWTRIVFNMLVSNTDDHLRNHAFLLDPKRGWVLSPAFDMNPMPDGARGLKLNVNQVSNDLDINLALEVAPQFRLESVEAGAIVKRVQGITSQWRKMAEKLGLSRREQDEMEGAFQLANKSST